MALLVLRGLVSAFIVNILLVLCCCSFTRAVRMLVRNDEVRLFFAGSVEWLHPFTILSHPKGESVFAVDLRSSAAM